MSELVSQWRCGDPRRSQASSDLMARLLLGSIKQLHERVTQECSEYRALYEKMVLPPDVGPRVDWARVLEEKQVGGSHTWTRSQGAQSHTRCKAGWCLLEL